MDAPGRIFEEIIQRQDAEDADHAIGGCAFGAEPAANDPQNQSRVIFDDFPLRSFATSAPLRLGKNMDSLCYFDFIVALLKSKAS